MRILALILCSILSACGGDPPPEGTALDPYTLGPGRSLPSGWDSISRRAFEELALRLPARSPRWSAADLEELDGALAGHDERAVRAAVLLAHDSHAEAASVMLNRLERRVPAPARPWDAPEIVCADALSGRAAPQDISARLVELADGARPHPDLEVRVECAAAALVCGDEGAVPFLIRVLRAETPAQRDDPINWDRVTTLFWAKRRASRALSASLGISCTFRPDGPWQHQQDEASAYAEAFKLEQPTQSPPKAR